MKKTALLSLLLLPFLFIGHQPVAAEAAYTPYQIPNGGFENGDLTGWQSYRLWKDESGMAAFDSSLVHNGTYFSSYPYGRDGSYQLGITSGSISWNQSEERMGYLRSSNFILGGSGWMSFKLGGGKHESFAYMSVRDASDDTEVARFANRHFNNTTKATAQYGSSISNAEAFLFQYYYDLDLVADLGDTLYIVLCDTSAYNWSILSADSIITFIDDEPIPSEDQTAINILPTISGIDTASNSIVNGYFDTDLTGWTLSGDTANGWYYSSSNYAKSNSSAGGGDAAIGIIRSSAFTVTTNKYIRFDWAGGMKYDKQIFISIKEIGTNIEKMRFVRRENLNEHMGTGFDNHMLNLSSLSDSKKYYLEFADNTTDSYGISFVDKIHLVPESEWNSVPSGDRAVSISGLPLSFSISDEQAAASFASYFLEQTAPYCETLDGANIDWTSLANEYATLSNEAKDYFVYDATDSEIVNARERYLYLVNKYENLAANPFMVDSENNEYDGSYDPILPPVISGENSKLALTLMIVLSTSMLAGTAFIYIRKKKRVY